MENKLKSRLEKLKELGYTLQSNGVNSCIIKDYTFSSHLLKYGEPKSINVYETGLAKLSSNICELYNVNHNGTSLWLAVNKELSNFSTRNIFLKNIKIEFDWLLNCDEKEFKILIKATKCFDKIYDKEVVKLTDRYNQMKSHVDLFNSL